MAILVSGDFHNDARGELRYLTKDYLINHYGKKVYESINYHIILGDAGFLWPGNEAKEAENVKVLAERHFPILCVIGNHEPVLGYTDLPEADIGIGEKVIAIKEAEPLIAYLKRGKVYSIENKEFLVLGGALSIDKYRRIPGLSWWENEYWSASEEKKVFKMLETQNKFDYVLSHTGPSRINFKVFPSYSGMFDSQKYYDKVAVLNEEIDKIITCKGWFSGHWHAVDYYYCKYRKRGYQYLYRHNALITEKKVIRPKYNTPGDLL